jgi:hypothetical protein
VTLSSIADVIWRGVCVAVAVIAIQRLQREQWSPRKAWTVVVLAFVLAIGPALIEP